MSSSCPPHGFAQPRRPSSSRSWAEVVSHSSLRAAAPPSSSPTCCEEFNLNASLDSLFQSQVALIRMELLQLVDVRVEEASRPLREEVAMLKLQLARVGDSREPTEACTYGCFSPHASLCTLSLPAASMSEATKAVAQDVQIMPELICGESSVVLPMELRSLEGLVVATTPSPPPSEPCQSSAHVDNGGLDASATLSSMAIGHVVSLSDEIAEASVLVPSSCWTSPNIVRRVQSGDDP
jgi:hypothetical protein